MAAATDFDSWLAALLSDQERFDEVWAHGETVVTRQRLRAGTERAAAALGAHGVRGGSTVAVQVPPSFTLLWSVFALWSAGAQVMLFDPRLTAAETTRLLELCEPQFHLTSSATGRPMAVFRDECEVVVERRRTGRPAQSEHALLQFSSGSTGLPKVIGRSGRSLLAEVERFADLPDMPKRGENLLLLSSLMHSFGLIGGVLHSLSAGVALHFAARPQPFELLKLMAERPVDAVFGVPVHFDLLSRTAAPPPLPALRLAVSGGEMLSGEVFDRFARRYGVRVGQAYGMTEAGIIATDLTGRHGPPAVGLPVPGVEAAVVDGTLRVRLAEDPYLHTDRAERFTDGWLNTYDRCRARPGSGVLEINGRADSVVAVGGLKVDLTEVEAVLAGHPEVGEAVVVFGEAIEAHVRVKGTLGKGALLDWCRERLSAHKIPKVFHFSAAALPRTSNGKLIRNRELLHAAREKGRQAVIR
ncbi:MULTISPECIES: class I adenylate-forming enzyme family protein [unclassified Streptomyces]|uniref:class I adenylate-forming enzyme family protein n=1 Tax=unclassified Streptomyces TaxID=2593676 RepID=UPI000F4E33FD|nr:MULTISPECIES: class I adenylate-forming enzyme family protein [unclassified Streptomyces]MDH6454515.1 acyl-coenzyme A synthetase/AMP-(fatty) acid ligase [Streptomyces sp. SAI-119]MDH6494927.1 acyl-coenzyme A synthetase/AMP-(fatty) acid ligase [Streptomyces sp. SAI-149]QUC57944.1 acyl--CoA ligase [Streptomyces sp. A2-16]